MAGGQFCAMVGWLTDAWGFERTPNHNSGNVFVMQYAAKITEPWPRQPMKHPTPTPQLELALVPDRDRCPHESTFYTSAYVPGGECCTECDTLLSQSIPRPPEVVGYLTADWAWKLEGNPWTTQILP